jgi:hypothetical protein
MSSVEGSSNVEFSGFRHPTLGAATKILRDKVIENLLVRCMSLWLFSAQSKEHRQGRHAKST